MLQISFTLSEPRTENPVGFELGDITIIGDSGEASSASRTPNQSMMLVLSIVEMLDGVRRFLLVSNAKEYRFVGVDSSFTIVFRKHKAWITVSVDGKLIHTTDASSLKVDFERCVQKFISSNEVSQIANSAEANDLSNAIRTFRAFPIN